MKRRHGKSGLRLLPILVALGLAGPALAQPVTQPAIFPAPVSIALDGGTVTLGQSVVLVVAPGADPESVALVRRILGTAGVTKLATASRLPATLDRPYVVLGTGEAAVVRDALTRSKAAQDSHKEGYTLASVALGNGSLITLAGHDNDGLFHAAQTLRQLVERPAIPILVIQDHPAMPIRGTIEGFYGAPWSMADRTKHLEFLARTKANTFIYSPKDDPYARDRWREAYPAATLKALGKLAATAKHNHVDFVYAISPGPTVCFSDPADAKALLRKFDAFRALGVRSFYVALDDIEYTKWNCERDKTTFGDSGAQAAGIAQSHLLNLVQADLVARHDASSELIMVPTEYFDAKESPYKEALRKHLDPKVVVQWTGTDVVPPAISIPDARAATKAFGRKTLLWDNYPVNDFETSAGRLLMAPYARREAGLSAELSGIVSNPMNQEVPSRVAVMGITAFAWNDKGYDAERTWHAAARDLAGGDARVTAALLTFFDTQHLAPTFGSQPWQEQAPQLKAVLDHVREAIARRCGRTQPGHRGVGAHGRRIRGRAADHPRRGGRQGLCGTIAPLAGRHGRLGPRAAADCRRPGGRQSRRCTGVNGVCRCQADRRRSRSHPLDSRRHAFRWPGQDRRWRTGPLRRRRAAPDRLPRAVGSRSGKRAVTTWGGDRTTA